MPRRKMSDKEVKTAAERAEGKATPTTPTLGRPVEYKATYAEQVKKLCKLGATEVEIADFFGINVLTLYRWKIKYPDFCKATVSGKAPADERVERSLYHRAVGYTFDAVKIFPPRGEATEPLIVPYREHVPPDTAACSLWLRNRRPEQWRDKITADIAVSGEVKFVVEDAPRMKTIEAVADEG